MRKKSNRFINPRDSFDELERNRRRRWYPSTMRIRSYLRNNTWGDISIDPIISRGKLLEIRVTIPPKGSWRLKEENFEDLVDNLFANSGRVLIVTSTFRNFGLGIINIAVNPYVRGYDQELVNTALGQMRNALRANFKHK